MASAVLVVSSQAAAQGGPRAASTSASGPSATAEQACPPPQVIPPALDALLNRMLKPGETFSMAGLTPGMLQDLATLQKEAAARAAKDWPNLCTFAAENASIMASGHRPRVVLMGDSITEYWLRADPAMFNADVVDRGIGGQTTPQMLLRTYPDVINLRPRVLHIMAGTNDISGNTGPETDQTIVDNIRAMVLLAKAEGIRVVLGSITPSAGSLGKPGFNPSARIIRVNARLRKLAAEQKIVFIDYHTPLADAAGGMRPGLANDGLHPNLDGYAIMKPLMLRAIAQAGGRP